MLCNIEEYKKMGQDLSLGQLYDVQIEIKNSDTPCLGLIIYYDNESNSLCKANKCVLI